MDLMEHAVKDCPPSIYYIPDFVSKDEEESLLHKVYSAPKPKWTQLAHRRLQNWGGLPHPKGMVAETLPEWLQVYTEKLSQLSLFKDKAPNHILVNEYLPGQGIMPHEDGPLFYPVVSTISLGSHTLLDFYYHRESLESTEGKDKDQCQQEEEDHDNTAGEISDKSNLTGNGKDSIEVTSKTDTTTDRHFLSVLLEPRSLVLVCGDMYTKHLHGIAERTQDIVSDKIVNLQCLSQPVSHGGILNRETRVSLTIRHVPRTVKAKFLFGRR